MPSEQASGDSLGSGGRHRLTVTFEDGQPKTIRDNLRLVGSDFVFHVEGSTASLGAMVAGEDLDGAVEEVGKLPFIDHVEVPEEGSA